MVNRNTGFTPNLMMLGREITLPIDLMIGTIETSNLSSSEYVVGLKNILQVHQLDRDNLLSSQLQQKKDYDLRLKVKTYAVGDLVYKFDSAKKFGQSP